MKSAGKNETLTNRKAVMLMMTAMVAVMMILLAVFWLSESQGDPERSRNRSAESLQ